MDQIKCLLCSKPFTPRRSSQFYCSVPCARSKNGGHNKKAETWWKNQNGYIEGRIWLADGTQISVKQHRYVAQGVLGRPLLVSEDVHHKNGIKDDNRPENLEVIDHCDHTRLSNSQRQYKKGFKLKLTQEQREQRSLKAISMGLDEMGRATLAKAKGLK